MNIGKRLKEARKEKGISLEEIASETKIRKKYLKALEENDFDQISGQVYVKAFIRGYGDVVDIDTEPLIHEYQEYIKEQEEAEKLEKEKEKEDKSFFEDNYMKIIVSLILIVSLALVAYYFFLSNNSSNNTNTVSSQKIVNNEVDEELTSQEDENDEIRENNSSIKNNNVDENMDSLENELTVENNNTNDVTNITDIENPSDEEHANETNLKDEEIEVVANERSWLQISSDEEIIFQGFFNSENQRRINLNEYDKITLKIGNGVGIYILHNNKKMGPWGESGEVIKKEIIFDDGLKIK